MNVWLVIAATLAGTLSVMWLRSWLSRRGYAVSVAIIVKRPRKNPRLPSPKVGHVVIPLQIRREFEEMLREGVTGIVSLVPVGDGTVTLYVQQTQPQGK